MKKVVVAVVAAFSSVAVRAADVPRAGTPPCDGPGCKGAADAGPRRSPPPAEGRAEKPRAKRAAPAAEAKKPDQKPCEEVKPCPIE